jgi:hypothetical protein
MIALYELNEYVREHVMCVPPGGPDTVIDVHFFGVVCSEDFDKEHFRSLFQAFVDAGEGEFGTTITKDDVKGGPSYITWGAWVGDQTAALMLMGAGQYAGMWEVVTPGKLGITGEKADELAGLGLVMTSGWKEAVDVERP